MTAPRHGRNRKPGTAIVPHDGRPAADPVQSHGKQATAGKSPGGGGWGGKGHAPFDGTEPWAFKPGFIANPTGRPKRLSAAYNKFLDQVDENGVSNADKIAASIGTKAMMTGDVPAAVEFRKATEGETVNFKAKTDAELDAEIAAVAEELRKLDQEEAGETVEGTFTVTPAMENADAKHE